MGIRLALCASLVGFVLISSARANPILTNGFLEKASIAKLDSHGLITVSKTKNKTALLGWSITSGTVNIVSSTYWQSPDEGGYSVDLVGTTGIGGIYQRVATTTATGYTLTFDLSANPEAGPRKETGTTKRLLVEALAADGKTVLASHEFDITNGTRTKTNMQYETDTFNFTATGAFSTIRLTALTPLNLPKGAKSSNIYCGPVIGNLNLTPSGTPPTPEPTSLSILGVSASALLLKRRRGR